MPATGPKMLAWGQEMATKARKYKKESAGKKKKHLATNSVN